MVPSDCGCVCDDFAEVASLASYREYVCKVCNDSLNITIVMGSQRS